MTTPLTRILLATDGMREATLAGRAATDISNKTAAELHVVHVWTPVPPPPYPGLVFDDHHRSAKEEAVRLLRKRAWDARVGGGRVAGEHLCEGLPAEEILVLAEELGADLVVVGSRRAGRARRLITGSVSEDVVHRASCPVLIVRGEKWPVGRVLVADDGSEPSRRAGDLAAEIAGLSGAEVVVVRAYEPPPEPVGGWDARGRRELDEALLQNRRDLKERAEQLEEIARCRPKTRLVKSRAASAIDLVAEEGDGEQTLFALGSRGLGAVGRAVLGSVSTAVLRRADGPVLVVPSRASRGLSTRRAATLGPRAGRKPSLERSTRAGARRTRREAKG